MKIGERKMIIKSWVIFKVIFEEFGISNVLKWIIIFQFFYAPDQGPEDKPL